MFNSTILQSWNHPYHRGLPAEVNLIGQEGFPGEGPYMQLAIILDGKVVREAWFETYACPAAVACGSRTTQWLEGRNIEDALHLGAREISALVGGLPLGKEHCGQITARALESVLRQCCSADMR